MRAGGACGWYFVGTETVLVRRARRDWERRMSRSLFLSLSHLKDLVDDVFPLHQGLSERSRRHEAPPQLLREFLWHVAERLQLLHRLRHAT